MARIVQTPEKKPKRFLLKAGLSIFLFLQIQMPDIAHLPPLKIHGWSLEISCKARQLPCYSTQNLPAPLAFTPELAK